MPESFSFRLIHSDANAALRGALVDQVINAVVTSPPYFHKREYGDNPDKEIGWGTVDEYVAALADVFQAVNLHDRGSIWVNLGDTRNGSGGLHMIPARFALEMERRGFLVADDVIWAKIEDRDDGTTEGCCMTEPANARLNGNGFEVLFRFTKATYPDRKGRRKVGDAWCDTCAVAIPRQQAEGNGRGTRYLPRELMEVETSIEGRNLHNLWRVGMGQTRESHYAVYPAALAERPIAMTCPHRTCARCGCPWERQIDKVPYDEGRSRSKRIFGKYTAGEVEELQEKSGRMDSGRHYIARKPVTRGWSATCGCGGDVVPGVVLDPFMGTASTGAAALRLGRKFVGIDLYRENIDISSRRLDKVLEFLRDNHLDPARLITESGLTPDTG